MKPYPSDTIPQPLYDTIKAHKPEKDFPMRVILSTMGMLPYVISKYLIQIIQSTLNKNQQKVKNLISLVSQAQIWEIKPNEIQLLYDVTNLSPSILIDEAIDVIMQQLNED